MSTFAEIDFQTNKVLRVIIAQSKIWCEYHLDGNWVKVHENQNKPSINWNYHADKNNFSNEQPYPSWTLDDNCIWIPPITIPENANKKDYTWNEETQTWNESES